MIDTLFYNTKAYSMEADGEYFSAIAVGNGYIKGLYKDIDINLIKAKHKVDLNGKIILPAFIESHTHFLQGSIMSVFGFSISKLVGEDIYPNSIETALELIKQNIKSCVKNKLNVASNFIIAGVKEQRLPFKEELDKVTNGIPLIIYSIDGHSCSCNTNALKLLEIDDTNNNGVLTGQKHDFMQGKITNCIMNGVTLKLAYKGICKLANESIKYGFSTITSLEGFNDSENDIAMQLFTTIMPHLPLNFKLFMQYTDEKKAEKYYKKQSVKRVGGCGVWEMDGSVGSKSAALYENYIDTNLSGELYYSDEERDNLFKKFNDNGVTLSSHAIGTKAITKTLDSFEKIILNGNNKLRHRIDHCEFPLKEDLDRLTKLNLYVTVQSGYAYFDFKYQHSYEKFLSKSVINLEIPLKTLMDKGVKILGSSDCPVQEINPFLQIQGMVLHPYLNERLSVYEALKTYTIFPSESLGEESVRGSLKIGKIADFGVYANDIFNIDKNTINTLECDELYFKGKKAKKLKGSMVEMLIKFLNKTKKL